MSSPNMISLGPLLSQPSQSPSKSLAISYTPSVQPKILGIASTERLNMNLSTTVPSPDSVPAMTNSTSPHSDLQNITPSREASPALSEASSDRTHISSGMRPVLQIPPFIEPAETGTEPRTSVDTFTSFAEQSFADSSSEDESKLRQSRQPRGPAHGGLPKSLQKLLSQYYQLNGNDSLPPCAVNKVKQSQLDGRRAGRHPLKYVNNEGERLTASCQPIGFDNKYVLIVQGEKQEPVIVKFWAASGTSAAQKQTPYRVWKGIDGWEEQPSVWKVRDADSMAGTPEVQPSTDVTETRRKSHENTTTSTPNLMQGNFALKNCQSCKDKHRRCDKALPSCSTCIEIGSQCYYMKGSLLASMPTPTSGYANQKQSTMNRQAPILPAKAQAPLSDSGSEIELDKELPRSLRATLDEYYEAQGSQTSPPCSSTSANAHSIYAFKSSGMAAKYVDIKGNKVHFTRHWLPENGTYANVVYGLENEPVFVRNQSWQKIPEFGNNQAAFFVWRGVEGFEQSPRVFKVADPEKQANRRPAALTNNLGTSSPRSSLKRRRGESDDESSSKRARTLSTPQVAGKPFVKDMEGSKSTSRERTILRQSRMQYIPQASLEKPSSTQGPNSLKHPTSFSSPTDMSGPARVTFMSETPASLSRLSPAQKANTTVKFLGGTRVRTRPFTACDSVLKLYMQASAAGLFDASTPNTIPFLTVKVGRTTVPIIRGDEDDFMDLENSIFEVYPDDTSGFQIEVTATE